MYQLRNVKGQLACSIAHFNKMNHNPLTLKVGDEVVHDADFNNHSIVKILAISSLGMFATVHPIEIVDESLSNWDTMTYRLTPKDGTIKR